MEISVFRPISLIGYKLVVKVFAARLEKVIGKLIVHDQIAFIRDVHLVDGVVALNEVVNLVRVSKKD